MGLSNRRINAFFISQVSYYLLASMFYSREKNNKINRIHEKYLRLNDNS